MKDFVMRALLKRLAGSCSGNITTTVALAAAPVLLSMGAAVDYGTMVSHRSALQQTADTAALAAAKELGIASTSPSEIRQIAERYAHNNFTQRDVIGEGNAAELKVDAKTNSDDTAVTVNLSFSWQPFFMQLIKAEPLSVAVTATARLAGEQTICVLALSPDDSQALFMSGASTIEAENCGVFSNSTSSRAISVVSQADMISAGTYSSGGYEGPSGSYDPVPVTDSPAITDPLANRRAPEVDTCTHNNFSLQGNRQETLQPGTYCGGLSLEGRITATLQPGIYIIKDGPLNIQGDSTIEGDNVGFYFTGDDAVFDFGVSTQASLTAPTSGELVGILFFEDRASPLGRDFTIRSKDAELFEGTVYLPRGNFIVDKASRVGQRSNWTAIIAHKIETKTGPSLKINSNYGGSTIPAPSGVTAKGGGTVFLSN